MDSKNLSKASVFLMTPSFSMVPSACKTSLKPSFLRSFSGYITRCSTARQASPCSASTRRRAKRNCFLCKLAESASASFFLHLPVHHRRISHAWCAPSSRMVKHLCIVRDPITIHRDLMITPEGLATRALRTHGSERSHKLRYQFETGNGQCGSTFWTARLKVKE